MTLDYNSLKRKIQDDLEIAKRMAKQELAIEKISKRMKRVARRERATQQMSNQVERIMVALESSSKMHGVTKASEQHHFFVFTSSREHKMESEKNGRNSMLQSELEYPTKVDEAVNKCNDDLHAEKKIYKEIEVLS
jgi:hypothetical protein